jgi:hypothetical protein
MQKLGSDQSSHCKKTSATDACFRGGGGGHTDLGDERPIEAQEDAHEDASAENQGVLPLWMDRTASSSLLTRRRCRYMPPMIVPPWLWRLSTLDGRG